MPHDKRQEKANPEQTPIDEEAEAAARADWEQLFRSKIPHSSDQAVIAAHFAEPMMRTLGLDPDKIPPDLDSTLQKLLKGLSDRQPPALGTGRVPPSGTAPTEIKERIRMPFILPTIPFFSSTTDLNGVVLGSSALTGGGLGQIAASIAADTPAGSARPPPP